MTAEGGGGRRGRRERCSRLQVNSIWGQHNPAPLPELISSFQKPHWRTFLLFLYRGVSLELSSQHICLLVKDGCSKKRVLMFDLRFHT